MARLPRLVLLVACIIGPAATAPLVAQLIDRTVAPNAANEGIGLSLDEQIGFGRGDRFTAADLTWVQVPHAQVPPASLTEAAEIIGAQARRRLAAHRVLTERDLGPPLLVRRGRPVELIYAQPGLYVTVLGVAQEDGALGELVRVINAESRRELQGVVSGSDEVAFGSAAAPVRSEGRAR